MGNDYKFTVHSLLLRNKYISIKIQVNAEYSFYPLTKGLYLI